MNTPRATDPRPTIWALAFGYFAFYIPYSALSKALSTGLIPSMTGPVSGLLILPACALATTITLLVFLTARRDWSCLQTRRVLGLRLPIVRPATLVSGTATAVIIGTTTLNYTFAGISILLALLLMRGGVLAIAPIVDKLNGRRVDPFSWAALGLSLAAVALAFSEVNNYRMTVPAALSIAAYLGGYVVRLNVMSRIAKSDEPAVNRRYFVEETAVAAVMLTAIPAVVAVIGTGEASHQLAAGFTSFFGSKLVLPALLIGVLYACLYMFGTAIYLDSRENTFCIPLNRGSSLMSGVVSSYGLSYLAGLPPPSVYQIGGAGLILLALACLARSSAARARPVARPALQRIFLFVCAGNTSRSPMAQAICNHEVARLLGLSPEAAGPILALSAGLAATPGRPFTEESISTLAALGVVPHDHSSRPLNPDLVDEAEWIFCMTESQRTALIERFPEAGAKVQRLDPDADIDDPSNRGPEAYRHLAAHLQRLLRGRLPALST